MFGKYLTRIVSDEYLEQIHTLLLTHIILSAA